MKHFALGWACNLNDIFVRFPYEKCKNLSKLKTKREKLFLIKRVLRYGLKLIIDDIIENNITFKMPGFGYFGGEIHMEAFKGSEFERVRKLGKFKKIDFLESLFTGFQMFLYIHGKRDDFLHRRKFPIYFSKEFRDKLIKYTNQGKQYC